MHTYQHMNQSNFKKPGAPACSWRAPGLTKLVRFAVLVTILLAHYLQLIIVDKQTGGTESPSKLSASYKI